jgi:integrase
VTEIALWPRGSYDLVKPIATRRTDFKLLMKPHIPMLKENNVRTGFFEREQFLSVQKHVPEDLRPLMAFFYLTGWRHSEVLALQWRHVDLVAGRVSLDPGTTKNDAGRTFPFTDELSASWRHREPGRRF